MTHLINSSKFDAIEKLIAVAKKIDDNAEYLVEFLAKYGFSPNDIVSVNRVTLVDNEESVYLNVSYNYAYDGETMISSVSVEIEGGNYVVVF